WIAIGRSAGKKFSARVLRLQLHLAAAVIELSRGGLANGRFICRMYAIIGQAGAAGHRRRGWDWRRRFLRCKTGCARPPAALTAKPHTPPSISAPTTAAC